MTNQARDISLSYAMDHRNFIPRLAFIDTYTVSGKKRCHFIFACNFAKC